MSIIIKCRRVVEADLLLETVSGDIYYGSLEATGGTVI